MITVRKILVTGSAGFIGFHLVDLLVKSGYEVFGIDVINDYYDINLKYARLNEHGINAKNLNQNESIRSSKYETYTFFKADLANHDFIVNFMVDQKFDCVINLAAQAGVRYSIDNPRAYIHSNIDGFLSILEGARYSNVKHLIYASTSSVYGLNTEMPLSEEQATERPMAIYAATKKANELMAHSYSNLFNLPSTGLRFFTVYGPWGRPDMALFLFTEAILKNEPIKLYNHGNMTRDFTYVADIVKSIQLLIDKPPNPDLRWNREDPKISTSSVPYQIFNIGNSAPISLLTYVEALEKTLGKSAQKLFLNIQPGDVPATHANTRALERYISFKPNTSIEEGVSNFISWYNEYNNVNRWRNII